MINNLLFKFVNDKNYINFLIEIQAKLFLRFNY